MTRYFLIFYIAFNFFSLRCFTQNASDDDNLRAYVRNWGQAEVIIPYSTQRALDDLSRVVSILDVRNKSIHISLSPLTIEWFIHQHYTYSLIERNEKKGIINALNLAQAVGFDTYPTYSQYDSIMQSFKTLYPGLCHLDTIGTSINGKLVLALEISGNRVSNEFKPEVFYTSTIHGDETGGFILMLRLADFLLKNYNINNRVKNLVDNLDIWINPLANPDGTYRTGNTISSPTRYNANGIDLNRNFPDPLQPKEVQQKENRDMIRFMRKHKFVISANFHSGAEVVNYPWDRWLTKIHADDTWFNSISRSYADTAHVYSGPLYMAQLDNGVTRGALWYIIYGGRQDFVTYELQGREVTIELDDQYITPASQLSSLWDYNWRSLLGYLENALYGIHGKVTSSATSAPLSAWVFISGHDKDSSQVYSDTLSGNFVRLIYPGTWDLSFSAAGYNDTTITNVVVLSGQKTEITVAMVPTHNLIDTTNKKTPFLYPDPASTEIKAILPHSLTGNLNIKIISLSGIIISDYNTQAVSGIPLRIDVSRLPMGTYIIVFRNRVTNISSTRKFMVIK